MNERETPSGSDANESTTKPAISRFWQDCERYHELAENVARDVVITHPPTLSGRHPGCPGDTPCFGWCRTGVIYYERVEKGRHSSSQWL